MTRKGFSNITAGKKWAANPSARGPRLMGNKLATESSPSRTWIRAKSKARAGTMKGKVKRDPGAMSKVGQSKAAALTKPAAPKQRKTRQQKAEQTARIQAAATKASNNPAVSKSGALRNEQRAIRAKKLNAIYKSPPIVEMSRGQKDRMIRVRKEIGVKSTSQSPNFGSKAPKPATPAAPKPAAAKGARLGGTRRTTQAAAPKNTTPNKTGQSKTLNRFNSRPVGTMVAGKRDNLVPSTKPVPLQVQRKESDLAFARIATKAARQRAAAPAKAAARQTAANRPARAIANQKRTAQAIVAKGGKRPTPTRKQKKSLAIADAARTFYSANRVNSLPGFKVNTSKPGYRKPKPRS